MADLKALSEFINNINRCDLSEIDVEMSSPTGALNTLAGCDSVKIKIKPPAAQMNEVTLRANDVLRNDVGLRPMMLRFAQTELDR